MPSIQDVLPESLHRLYQAHGLDPILKLVEAKGGRALYMPSIKASRLQSITGAEAAAWLMQEYPGETIIIPKCAQYFRTIRNHDLYKKHVQQGISIDQLSQETGLHSRHIFRLIAEVKQSLGHADDQLELTL